MLVLIVGYETRNIDVRDLLHNSNPESTLYANGNITVYNIKIDMVIKKMSVLIKIFQSMRKSEELRSCIARS